MKKLLVYLLPLKHNKKTNTSYFSAYVVDHKGELQVLWPEDSSSETMSEAAKREGFDYISRRNELDVAFCIKIDEDTDHHTLACQRVQTILRNRGVDVVDLEIRALLGRTPFRIN